MHHKGSIYRADNIQALLDQRYLNAQIRKQGGRHKGPPPFTKIERLKLAQAFKNVIKLL
mgnify:CR=1 FL=1